MKKRRTAPNKLAEFGVYLGVKTSEDFLCFVAIVRVRVYYVDVLLSLFC